ncbi:MAG TPA: hypothetical protein VFM43_07925 [Gaiellaceae bacterium]|nr:hypothetical protein [Gaiellaceae bacterium]
MRIVLPAAAILVLAACGSAGETAGPSVTPELAASAVAAPVPPKAGSRYLYELNHVACAAAGECVATGELTAPGSALRGVLLVEHGGKWALTEPPLPPDLGAGAKRGVVMGSVSCPAVGRCVAVGTAEAGGQSEPLVLTQQPSGWREAVLRLPAGANGDGLGLVSCPSAGNCTAAGNYIDSAGRQHGLLVTESGGRWGPPVTAGLPANAGTVAEGEAPEIDALSCASAGDCTAVGLYGDAFGSPQGWLLTETKGKWARGVEAQLPADADYSEGSYLYPVFTLGWVSCASAGNCTALGGYVDRRRNLDGLILTEHGGRWSTGEAAPVPSDAGPSPQEGDGPESPMRSLACGSSGSCGVVGLYRDRSDHDRPLLLAGHAGRWKTSVPSLPADAARPTTAGLETVACTASGACIAAGSYTTTSKTGRLFFVAEKGGRWGSAVGVALPPGADERLGGYFTSIACPAAGACVAVGEYYLAGGDTAAMIVTISRS